MPKDPTITDARLREAVREVLNMAPGYGYSERALASAAGELVRPAPVPLNQLRAAIEWNHAKGFVTYSTNEDTDEDEWHITTRGQAKERAGAQKS